MRALLLVLVVIVTIVGTGCSALIVGGKRFGAPPQDVRFFVTPNTVRLYPSADAAWVALTVGYIYRPDDWHMTDHTGQSIGGGKDTWLYPIETQILVDAPQRAMDCEDGAAWLASALKKQGYDAWLCVGTILVDGQTYGHAWTMVSQNGQWTTYETTIADISPGLPGIYTLVYRTDGTTTWRNALVTGTDVMIDPLPPDLLGRLREELR
jgi:hypothetical protein